jgi:hypothetical protein
MLSWQDVSDRYQAQLAPDGLHLTLVSHPYHGRRPW